MTLADPIGDMITRIRNAQLRELYHVKIPNSKFRAKILEVLKQEGYISNYKLLSDTKNKSTLMVDLKYYNGLTNVRTELLPSVMITDDIVRRNEWGDATIIGGNWVWAYGGFDSYQVALELGHPITAVTTGRMKPEEDEILNHVPWVTWREWIDILSQFNIGVHLMRTHAAGTFAMNCAFHGIPCIGYEGLDTQETLHQHLSVKVGDLDKAKHLAIQLKNDDGFYQMCSNSSQEMFKKFYTEEKWLENWREINEN